LDILNDRPYGNLLDDEDEPNISDENSSQYDPDFDKNLADDDMPLSLKEM